MPEILRYPVTIREVKEIRVVTGGHKDESGGSVIETASAGWYIILDNYIRLPCGAGKPEFAPGDTCRLTLEKYP